MFAPEKYVSLKHAYYHAPTEFDFGPAPENFSENTIGQTYNPKMSITDILEHQVLRWAFEDCSPRLCSPKGEVIKLDGHGLFDRIDFPPELEQVADEIELASMGLSRAHISIEILDEMYGEGAAPPRPSMPLFYNRSQYIVSLKNYKKLKEIALRVYSEEELFDAMGLAFETDPDWSVFEAFEGWAICMPEENFTPESSHSRALPSLGQTKKSRAQLKREIIEGFQSKAFQTKQEARELYSTEAVSIRGFNLSWADAAETVPEISRSGRRSSKS